VTLTVVKPGMLTTVQDLGRRGYRGVGVPVSGPMDAYSHRLANAVLGNDPMAAALEITLLGPELVSDGDVVCAVAGADLDVAVDGVAVRRDRPFEVRSGACVRFGARRRGARMTLAVAGGFDLPVTLGSRATHLASHMGPFGGRALRSGDVLPVGAGGAGRAARAGGAGAVGAEGAAGAVPLELPEGGATVRVLPAVHRDRFTDAAWQQLTHGRYVVTPQSNRMGYRLDGAALAHAGSAEILSEGMSVGAVQVPAAGQPILLMAECATTGGYPTIANVITADLPLAGQLAPGDWIEFVPCTRDAALAALRSRTASLGVRPGSDGGLTRV
jgi:antagonist of KipI